MKVFDCESCSAPLEWSPRSAKLVCPYCESKVVVPPEGDVVELGFEAFLARLEEAGPREQRPVQRCQSCGAETVLGEREAAGRCSYCDTPIVAEPEMTNILRPRSVLPFKVTKERGVRSFKRWLGSLWFAPNALKREADRGGLDGVYMPYFTYDSRTRTRYRGRRGEHYWETESYTTIENGKSVRKTRQVRKTRWYPASGTVARAFDDVLVPASSRLPQTMTDELEPWDLEGLAGFQEEYLAGFRAERATVSLARGFERAKLRMWPKIRTDICRDIGGDTQKITSHSTIYARVTFKSVLLPIWLSSYRYRGKVYRFLINGRTGEVQGERPYSWIKITLAVIAVIALIAGIVAAKQHAG